MRNMSTGERICALSRIIDEPNQARDPEAILWGRVSKVAEEAGEVITAMIGMTGQNFRKGVTHSEKDIETELFDVALTALAAVAHIRGNGTDWEPGEDGIMDDFAGHVQWVLSRALGF